MTQIAIARNVRAAGLYRSPSRTVPSGVSRITVALDSDWTSAYDVALLGIEVSFDAGATWAHSASCAIYGGARARDGSLPSLTLKNPPAGQYRLFILLSSGADLGLSIDVL